MHELGKYLGAFRTIGLRKLLEQIRVAREYFTPDMIRVIQSETRIPDAEFPEQLDLTNTGFWRTITAFDNVVGKKRKGLISGEDAFWQEYNRSIYDVDGHPVIGPTSPGGDAKASIARKTSGEPHISNKRIWHHSHPTRQSFSPVDLGIIVRARFPESQITEDREMPWPPLRLLGLSTSDGSHFFTFSSQETPLTTRDDLKELGMVHPPPEGYYQSLFSSLWQELRSKYDTTAFTGENTRGRSAYPLNANEDGIALITLADVLKRSAIFRLPFYNGAPGSPVFRRIRNLEDVYPSLRLH